MKKVLTYFGLIDGRKITPLEQENFGKYLFIIAVSMIILIPILIGFNVL